MSEQVVSGVQVIQEPIYTIALIEPGEGVW